MVGSMCFRTGSYNVYIPKDRLHFLKGEEMLQVRRRIP